MNGQVSVNSDLSVYIIQEKERKTYPPYSQIMYQTFKSFSASA